LHIVGKFFKNRPKTRASSTISRAYVPTPIMQGCTKKEEFLEIISNNNQPLLFHKIEKAPTSSLYKPIILKIKQNNQFLKW
jgi:hypothetical protein